jgi:uncharacterized protein (DUF488 family)
VGHSTRSLDELIEILRAFEIQTLVDIRTVPASRRLPQFMKANLEQQFPAAGIRYLHMPGLGGLRKPRRDSINTAWRNESFRGYADYMQTPEFEAALEELMRIASASPTAIMCAEAVPWRCHRSLVADALTVRAWDVEHILSRTSAQRHHLRPFARVDGQNLVYPR